MRMKKRMVRINLIVKHFIEKYNFCCIFKRFYTNSVLKSALDILGTGNKCLCAIKWPILDQRCNLSNAKILVICLIDQMLRGFEMLRGFQS